MVGAEDGFVDVGGAEAGFKRGRDEEVVDTPANVIYSGFAPVRPPRIAPRVGVEEAESVEETGVEEVGDSLSFFIGKAGVVVIRTWAGKVNFFVSGVKVSTGYNGFFFFEVF